MKRKRYLNVQRCCCTISTQTMGGNKRVRSWSKHICGNHNYRLAVGICFCSSPYLYGSNDDKVVFFCQMPTRLAGSCPSKFLWIEKVQLLIHGLTLHWLYIITVYCSTSSETLMHKQTHTVQSINRRNQHSNVKQLPYTVDQLRVDSFIIGTGGVNICF